MKKKDFGMKENLEPKKPESESVNGPVTRYQLSEEELAKYRAMEPPKKVKRPIRW